MQTLSATPIRPDNYKFVTMGIVVLNGYIHRLVVGKNGVFSAGAIAFLNQMNWNRNPASCFFNEVFHSSEIAFIHP